MREAREYRDLSLMELSDKMEVAFDQLKALEATGDDVELPFLLKLSKELNVPVEGFFDDRVDFKFGPPKGNRNNSKISF